MSGVTAPNSYIFPVGPAYLELHIPDVLSKKYGVPELTEFYYKYAFRLDHQLFVSTARDECALGMDTRNLVVFRLSPNLFCRTVQQIRHEIEAVYLSCAKYPPFNYQQLLINTTTKTITTSLSAFGQKWIREYGEKYHPTFSIVCLRNKEFMRRLTDQENETLTRHNQEELALQTQDQDPATITQKKHAERVVITLISRVIANFQKLKSAFLQQPQGITQEEEAKFNGNGHVDFPLFSLHYPDSRTSITGSPYLELHTPKPWRTVCTIPKHIQLYRKYMIVFDNLLILPETRDVHSISVELKRFSVYRISTELFSKTFDKLALLIKTICVLSQHPLLANQDQVVIDTIQKTITTSVSTFGQEWIREYDAQRTFSIICHPDQEFTRLFKEREERMIVKHIQEELSENEQALQHLAPEAIEDQNKAKKADKEFIKKIIRNFRILKKQLLIASREKLAQVDTRLTELSDMERQQEETKINGERRDRHVGFSMFYKYRIAPEPPLPGETEILRRFSDGEEKNFKACHQKINATIYKNI